MGQRLSVIIPAYNEADNIVPVVQSAAEVITKTDFGDNFEIIVVDDHSDDATFERVATIHDGRVRCIRLSRRSGSHVAIRAGLLESTGDAALFSAADGQDDLNVLRSMIDQWHNGYKVVWACREKRDLEPLWYRFTAGLFYKLLVIVCNSSSQGKVYMTNGDFFLLDRLVIDALNKCHENQTSILGLIVWFGFPQASVSYVRKSRMSGQSKWNLKRRLSLARDWVMAFSGFPVRVIFFIGFMITFLSLLDAVWALGHSEKIPLTMAMFFLGGVQLMAIGVIGEYTWSALRESRHRPLYFVEKRIGEKRI